MVEDLPDKLRVKKAARHYWDAFEGRKVRHSIDLASNKLMRYSYTIQTSLIWSKLMVATCWAFLLLTLFEPKNINDDEIAKWSSYFDLIFIWELCVLVLFLLDYLMALYHNFHERLFKEFRGTSEMEEEAADVMPGMARKSMGINMNSGQAVFSSAQPRQDTGQIHASSEPLNLKAPSLGKNSLPTANLGDKFKLQKEKYGFCKYFWILVQTTLFEADLFPKGVLLVIFWTDFVLFISLYPDEPMRFGRFFRSITFTIFSKSTKRTLQAMIGSMRRILDFFIFFASIIFIYAGLGYRILQDEESEYYLHAFYDSNISDYNSYSVIVNSLMVLVTFDNYPLLMRPALAQSYIYLAYFMPFIMLTIFFFIPIPIAVVYDGFREKRSKLVIQDHLKEKEALFSSYLALTGGDNRALYLRDLDMLLNEVYGGHLRPEQVKMIFQHLDIYAKGKFHINEFLTISDIINSDPSLVAFDRELMGWKHFKSFINKHMHINKLVSTSTFEIVMLVVVLINSAAVIATFIDEDPDRQTIYDSIDSYFVIAYIMEFVLKVVGLGILDYFRDNWNKMDFAFIILSLTTDFAFSVFKIVRNVRTAKAVRVARTAKVRSSFRKFRFIRKTKCYKIMKTIISFLFQPFANVQKFVSMLMVCVNMISQTGTILVMIFHIYAMIGMTIYNTKLNDFYPSAYYETSISDFNSYDRALVVMLQTITENGWSSILIDYAVKFGSLFRAAAFFHSFYHLAKFIILSLLTGLIWEIFSIVSARMEARDLQEAAQAEQDSLDSKKASMALQELDGASYCSENLGLDVHTLMFGQDETLLAFRKKLKQAKKEEDVAEVEMVRDDYSFEEPIATKPKTPLLAQSRGSRRGHNIKEFEANSNYNLSRGRKSITKDDLAVQVGHNHERRASLRDATKRAHSMGVEEKVNVERWLKHNEPESQPLSVFLKKRLKKRITEAKEFIQILSGFDIDIFLNFAPEDRK